jgi:hypothetical protein
MATGQRLPKRDATELKQKETDCGGQQYCKHIYVMSKYLGSKAVCQKMGTRQMAAGEWTHCSWAYRC